MAGHNTDPPSWEELLRRIHAMETEIGALLRSSDKIDLEHNKLESNLENIQNQAREVENFIQRRIPAPPTPSPPPRRPPGLNAPEPRAGAAGRSSMASRPPTASGNINSPGTASTRRTSSSMA